VVMVSILFIYKCITSSTTVNQCMGFTHISQVIEGTYNNEVISIHSIVINYGKTRKTKFMKRTCQFPMCAVVSTWDM
jgi:hypothetical protein